MAHLTAERPPTGDEALTMAARTDDGARRTVSRSLRPTVRDEDSNGVADGWQINPQSSPVEGKQNVARVSLEPGDAEFFCQRIDCPQFVNGWIILHRDRQDPIVQGRRYRIRFRARQQGLEGTVGVAVYNIQPWQSCGIEQHFRIPENWQSFTTPFTATRDSDNVRFEFYFIETGTLWLEGMRLEEVEK
jgi:hypothetical protein